MEPSEPSPEHPSRPERWSRTWKVRTFRQWHRWIGAAAGLFILYAASTGTVVAFTEFFGAEERLREANRKLVSPLTVDAPGAEWQAPIAGALEVVRGRAPGAPIDKVTVEFKGEAPRVMVFTGKPGGGEDRKFVVDAHSGRLLSEEAYADKPFLYRVHSGEIFGDGGLVVAMLWGLALVLMSLSGMWIYWSMRRRDAEGMRRFFW